MKKVIRTGFYVTLVLILGFAIIGCEAPTGPKGKDGEDGNANVTLYTFDGYDFNSGTSTKRTISDVTEAEMDESAWLVYLAGQFFSGPKSYYQLPGPATFGTSEYSYYFVWDSSDEEVSITVLLDSGEGEEYDEIRIVRIASSEQNDLTTASVSTAELIPGWLDTSDFEAVAEYYGLE